MTLLVKLDIRDELVADLGNGLKLYTRTGVSEDGWSLHDGRIYRGYAHNHWSNRAGERTWRVHTWNADHSRVFRSGQVRSGERAMRQLISQALKLAGLDSAARRAIVRLVKTPPTAADLVAPEKIAEARRGLGLSTAELGIALGLAFTQDDEPKRRDYAARTVRRWETEGAPPWGWLAIRCLFYDRGLKPPK